MEGECQTPGGPGEEEEEEGGEEEAGKGVGAGKEPPRVGGGVGKGSSLAACRVPSSQPLSPGAGGGPAQHAYALLLLQDDRHHDGGHNE